MSHLLVQILRDFAVEIANANQIVEKRLRQRPKNR